MAGADAKGETPSVFICGRSRMTPTTRRGGFQFNVWHSPGVGLIKSEDVKMDSLLYLITCNMVKTFFLAKDREVIFTSSLPMHKCLKYRDLCNPRLVKM